MRQALMMTVCLSMPLEECTIAFLALYKAASALTFLTVSLGKEQESRHNKITEIPAGNTKVFEGTPGNRAMCTMLQAIEALPTEDASEVAVVLDEGPQSSFGRPPVEQ